MNKKDAYTCKQFQNFSSKQRLLWNFCKKKKRKGGKGGKLKFVVKRQKWNAQLELVLKIYYEFKYKTLKKKTKKTYSIYKIK